LPPETLRLVEPARRERLCRVGGPAPLIGICALADGADQLFAEAVLEVGGSLEVVIPADGYRESLPPDSVAAFDRLLARASAVQRLGYPESTSDAHEAAGRLLVGRSDVLVAVWDGLPARGPGGTGDVVAYARAAGIPVEIVWPSGARR